MLSAGQRRRVALARLLLGTARLWILDEPFTAIDKAGVDNIERLIREHVTAGGMAILTTHHPADLKDCKVRDLHLS
jgi:heme exporter protein A